jgi:hypothetical protein
VILLEKIVKQQGWSVSHTCDYFSIPPLQVTSEKLQFAEHILVPVFERDFHLFDEIEAIFNGTYIGDRRCRLRQERGQHGR